MTVDWEAEYYKQIEDISELETEMNGNKQRTERYRGRIIQLEDNEKLLLKLIDGAPHTFKCNAIPKNNGKPCTCWKQLAKTTGEEG